MKFPPAPSLFIGIFLTAAAVYAFQLGGPANELLESLIYLIPPTICAVAGLRAAKAYGLGTPHGQALALLTLGLACWLAGELAWTAFDYVLKIDPFPSVADVFYLLGYPFILIGLVKEISLAKLKLTTISPAVFFLAGLASAFILSTIVFFGILRAYQPDVAILDNLIATSYGVGDLVLLVPALLILAVAWEYKGGQFSRLWLLIFLGLILTLAGDVLFAAFQQPYTNQLFPYELIDLTWTASYLLIALAFIHALTIIKTAQNRLRPRS